MIRIVIDAAPETADKRLKVLLVDDDDFIHEMTQLVLANTQYDLVSATNVEDAMKLIFTEIPDIVITDAMMPGESGFSLIAKMKTSPDTKNIPVILWTILEEVNGGVMDSSLRADVTVSKPFYLSNIMDGLERAKQLIDFRRVVTS